MVHNFPFKHYILAKLATSRWFALNQNKMKYYISSSKIVYSIYVIQYNPSFVKACLYNPISLDNNTSKQGCGSGSGFYCPNPYFKKILFKFI